MSRVAAALCAMLLIAVPAVAQEAPPPPGMAGPGAMMPMQRGWPRGLVAGLSADGQRMMQEAFRDAGVANRADKDRVRAARDRIVELLSAERLDVTALKRAMSAERAAAQAMKSRQQATLLGVYQRLSLADRRAVAESARNLRERFEDRRSGPDARPGERP